MCRGSSAGRGRPENRGWGRGEAREIESREIVEESGEMLRERERECRERFGRGEVSERW